MNFIKNTNFILHKMNGISTGPWSTWYQNLWPPAMTDPPASRCTKSVSSFITGLGMNHETCFIRSVKTACIASSVTAKKSKNIIPFYTKERWNEAPDAPGDPVFATGNLCLWRQIDIFLCPYCLRGAVSPQMHLKSAHDISHGLDW